MKAPPNYQSEDGEITYFAEISCFHLKNTVAECCLLLDALRELNLTDKTVEVDFEKFQSPDFDMQD